MTTPWPPARPSHVVGVDVSPLINPLTGIGYYVLQLVSRFIRLRPDIRWAFLLPPGCAPEKRASVPRPLAPYLARTGSHFWFPRCRQLMLLSPWQRLLTAERYAGEVDVFHGTNFLAPSLRRGRSVVTVHDLSVLLFPEYHPWTRVLGFRVFFGATLARADGVITVSQQTKRDLVRLMGFPEEKVTVIPLAPNEAFQPVNQADAVDTVTRYGLQPGRYFLHVGTVEPRKNLLRLLRAFERISRADPRAPDLVFVGGSGWRNREFYRAIETSPAGSRVRLMGYLPEHDLAALYSASLATVYPSLYEGFGLPPLEAMACGAPVVTSNTSSLPEVVGDAALLVDPRDVGAIEAALVQVKEDPVLREALRAKGLQRAKQFSWDVTARRTLEVYGVADALTADLATSGLEVA